MGELAVRPVLHTDVLVDHLRGRGPGRDLIQSHAGSLGYRVTAVTAFELALARSYAADPSPVRALVSVPCLPLGRRAGLRAGALVHDLRTAGSEIAMRDSMQAAICLEAGVPLVTGNVRHFERLEGLNVVQPDQWVERHV
jgi:tRNA(fMet)-specific endonuclease VapC